MKRLVGAAILTLGLAACAGGTPVVVSSPEEPPPVPLVEPEAPAPEEQPQQEGPQPYASDEKCKSFHDNELIGEPYALGFHYCLYAEAMDTIVDCEFDLNAMQSVCTDHDDEPHVGVQWHQSTGVFTGGIYVPRGDDIVQVGAIEGNLQDVPGGRVMHYNVHISGGRESTCVVGGPTVQYCRVNW